MKKNSSFNLQYILMLIFISVVFFLLTTALTYTRFTRPIDVFATDFLQSHIPPKWDTFLSLFSLISNFEVIVFVATVLLLIYKKIRELFVVMSLLMLGHVIEFLGKNIIFHPKPPTQLGRSHLALNLPSQLISTFSSYPSGHSFRCVYFATLLAYFLLRQKNSFTKWLGLLIVATWVGITLTTRISLGEHWMSDVVGGAWLGLALGGVTIWLLKNQGFLKLWQKLEKNLASYRVISKTSNK